MSNDTIPSMTGALADLAARLLAAKEGGTAEPVEINRDGHPVDVSVMMTLYNGLFKMVSSKGMIWTR